MQVQNPNAGFEDESSQEAAICKNDPWSINGTEIVVQGNAREMYFDDDFASHIEVHTASSKDNSYVPLDDSQQYLASLENKLARLQGKSNSKRENEKQNLIRALALSREDHAFASINSDLRNDALIEDESSIKLSALNSIDPKGTLGFMMRKLAPDHVALSADELCELLKEDLLSKMHSALEEEELAPESSTYKEQNSAPEL